MRADCVPWLADLERSTPSVILDAYVDGRQALDARVTIDGALAAEHIDGRPVDIDPGRHVFRIEVPGFPPSEQVLVIPEGTKGRVVSASFEHPKLPCPPAARGPAGPFGPCRAWVWVGGGVANAGAVGTAIFGELALSEKHRLSGSCAPFCSTGQRPTPDAYMVAADVSLGVAVAGAAGAGMLYVLRPSVEQPAAVSLDGHPARGWG